MKDDNNNNLKEGMGRKMEEYKNTIAKIMELEERLKAIRKEVYDNAPFKRGDMAWGISKGKAVRLEVLRYQVMEMNGAFYYDVTGFKVKKDGSKNFHTTTMFVKTS